MAQTQVQSAGESQGSTAKVTPEPGSTRPRSRLDLDTSPAVHQFGCFEADRVLKSGYVLRRTRKTKVSRLIVLSPQ